MSIDISAAADLFAALPATDWSRRMIDVIFGTTTEASSVSSLFRIIASALVIIGTMFLGYNILSTIVGAARAGRVLPESMSGAWVALRPTIGFGMLVPITVAGLSGVHYLVREVATIGANLGNAIALQYVENAAISGGTSLPISGSGQQLVYGLVRAEVCAAVRIKAGHNTFNEATTSAAKLPAVSGSEIKSGERRSWWTGEVTEAGRVSGYAWDYGPACGSVSISNPENFGSFGETRRQAVAAAVTAIRDMNIGESIAPAFDSPGIYSTPGGSGDTDTLNKSLIAAWRNSGVLVGRFVVRLNEIASDYDRNISQAARSSATTSDTGLRQKLVDHVRSCGWACVGGYYRVLGTLNLAAASMASEKPTVTRPNPDAWGLYGSSIGEALKLIDNQILIEGENVRLTAGDLRTQADDDAESTFSKITQSITQPLKDYFTQYNGLSPDPVSELMNIGNHLLVASETAFGIGAAATGGAHFFGSSAGAVLDFFMRAGWPAIAAAYGAGVLLLYIQPLTPWIYVYYSFIAWALELMIASIAVLVWAFSHLRLDGGSFVDRAQVYGYGSLFISILLRPAIIVVAYVAAISVSNVGLHFLRYSFSFASDAAIAGYTIGLSGILVYGILVVAMQFMTFHYIFKGIPSAPERIGMWFGLTISSWRESEGGALIMGAVSGRLGGMGRGGVPGVRGAGTKASSATPIHGGDGAGASSGPGVSRPKG